MPPSPGAFDSAERWLRYARADLKMALADPPDGVYELLCFHAQQAVEKGLKAVLTHLSIAFPKTHDLQLLVSLLPPQMRQAPELRGVERLTPYAIATRYPGMDESVDQREYRDAIQVAQIALDWALQQVG